MQTTDLLEIYTFGDVVIQWRTKATRLTLSPREALLLVYLAYQRVPVSRSHLCHLFWPDETPLRAHGNLRKLLVDVRKSLNDLIISTREEVTLHPELSYWLDVHEFQWQMQPLAQLHKAGNGQPDIDLPRLIYGIQLYTGEFLGHIKPPKSHVFGAWLDQAQTHLHQQVIQALKLVIQSCRQHQHDGEAMHYAKRLLTLDPFDEEAHEQVMLLWAEMGYLDEAVQHYNAYCRLLQKELATTPEPQLVALYEQIRGGKTPKAPTRPVRPLEAAHNEGWPLPQLPKPLTPLLGRAESLRQLQHALTDATIRLVTLVGMGGIGKTHLALTVAEQLLVSFGTCAVFVPLHELPHADTQRTMEQPIRGQRSESRRSERQKIGRPGREDSREDGNGGGDDEVTDVDSEQEQNDIRYQLALATATALHLPLTAPTLLIEQIGAYLYDKPWLLIFDGFEHFGAGAAFLTTLLQVAPAIKVLVTTRECLQVPGESIMRLEGLPRPTLEDMKNLQQPTHRQADNRGVRLANQDLSAQRSPSLQLLIQCLQRQTPGLVLQPTCVQHMVHICHLVEGHPLALELAAGLSSHYSWSEITEGLQRNVEILRTAQRGRPQRQRSMTTVLDDAWHLLTPPERTTLVGLSVFADTFSRTAAVAVTASPPEILMTLVNKSWVRSQGAGRYELPRLIRLFTTQKLKTEFTVRQQLQAAHARYYLDYFQEEIAHRQALAGDAVVTLLAYELGNLLTACQWVYQQGTPAQRQQYQAILALLRRCATAVTPTLTYGASMVWAASPLLSLMG